MKNHIWQLQEAKARFSEFVRASEKHPQTVTVRGKQRVIMLSWVHFREMMGRYMDEMEQKNEPPLTSHDEKI